MGLFGKKESDSGMKVIFGPDGESHLSFKAGNMTFVDGKTYVGVGEGMAMEQDGEMYFGAGNAVFGSDGQAHLKFGDNPTFLI